MCFPKNIFVVRWKMEQEKNEVEILSSSNEYEINQVCSILEDNNIPFIRKDYVSGSYMNIYFGQSIQEIFYIPKLLILKKG